MRDLAEKLRIARGESPVDLLVRNAQLVNVFSGEIHDADVAVADGRVIGFGDYEARRTIDLERRYLLPSFIDGHMHLESTMLTAPEFARAVVPHGTGAVVIDPHEYANVLGLDGIRYVLDSTKDLPVDFFVMLPSCVPATSLETSGARLEARDLQEFIRLERIAGIAELMNFPGVYLGLQSELDKISAGKGRAVDGHAPGLRGKNLNAYVLAGVQSDHESTEIEEAREKLRLGMHLLIREGSTEKNLQALLPLVTPSNSMNCSFATDDVLPQDLAKEGHIDRCVRKTIRSGLPPITAVQMATINTARHYRLRNRGAVAPRFWADMLVCDDLSDLRIRQVYRRGALVAENGVYLSQNPPSVEPPGNTVNVAPISLGRLQIKAIPGNRIKVIEIIPQQIITRKRMESARVEGGLAVPDPGRDLLKLVVVERHRATGNVGLGFVRGFQLKEGALGSTFAHDAHNIIAVGTNDDDILFAIHELIRLQGGQVVVAGQKLKAGFALPIAGLVSDRHLKEVIGGLARLDAAAAALGCRLESPFMALSFLSLSPVPSLKLTDQGLVDSDRIELTSLFAD